MYVHTQILNEKGIKNYSFSLRPQIALARNFVLHVVCFTPHITKQQFRSYDLCMFLALLTTTYIAEARTASSSYAAAMLMHV
jgi:hypothetical protein